MSMHSVLNNVETYPERRHMETSTGMNGGTRKRRTPIGRKNEDKQEQVIEFDEIKSSLSELVGLYQAAEESNTTFSDAIKETAERSGILAGTLRKFVVAKAGEQFEERKRACQQLSLLFESISD